MFYFSISILGATSTNLFYIAGLVQGSPFEKTSHVLRASMENEMLRYMNLYIMEALCFRVQSCFYFELQMVGVGRAVPQSFEGLVLPDVLVWL